MPDQCCGAARRTCHSLRVQNRADDELEVCGTSCPLFVIAMLLSKADEEIGVAVYNWPIELLTRTIHRA